MPAVVVEKSNFADRASCTPGEGWAVPGAHGRTGVNEVGAPVDPEGRRPDSHRQVQRAGVVGDDDRAPTQKTGEPAKREPPAKVEGVAIHSVYHPGDERPVFLYANHGYAGSYPR